LLQKNVELKKKLEDPKYKEFYDADKSEPKDELLSFDEWLP